jgi:hypothetical protein
MCRDGRPPHGAHARNATANTESWVLFRKGRARDKSTDASSAQISCCGDEDSQRHATERQTRVRALYKNETPACPMNDVRSGSFIGPTGQ